LQNGGWKGERFNAAFDSLMEVAEATSGHPGHKNVVWIGRGFPSINMETLSGSVEEALRMEIQTCTNLLRDARVTLYTIDPAGLSTTPAPLDPNGFEMDPFGGQVNFNDMASATGGRTFRNRNDVDAMIGTSIRDGSDFYTLSYMPMPATEDEKPFRSVRIVMKDKSLHATTRAGYYATVTVSPAAPTESPASAAAKPSRRAIFDLSVAGASTMVYDGIPFTLTLQLPITFRSISRTSPLHGSRASTRSSPLTSCSMWRVLIARVNCFTAPPTPLPYRSWEAATMRK
jgi:hypothetical protein